MPDDRPESAHAWFAKATEAHRCNVRNTVRTVIAPTGVVCQKVGLRALRGRRAFKGSGLRPPGLKVRACVDLFQHVQSVSTRGSGQISG
jgi:hypothetical protein